MSIIDEALEANKIYAKTHDKKLAGRPTPKIAVITCMDPRLSNLPAILGLTHADIDVIRTGGNRRRARRVGRFQPYHRNDGDPNPQSHRLRIPTFTDDELNAKLAVSTGHASPVPMRFFSYHDPEQHTREQIEKIRSHPWIAKDVPVRGFVFDMESGLMSEVRVSQPAAV